MFEMLIIGFLVFGAGSYLGHEKATQDNIGKVERPAQSPDKWQPVDHDNLLRTCGIVCGERRVKSYNSVYGRCDCGTK